MTGEPALAARVLDALLREDYGGLRRYAGGEDGAELRPPGGPAIRLRSAGLPGAGLYPGFLAERVVDPGQGLRLDDVLAIARQVADPRDDIAGFEQECREALAALRAQESARAAVLDRVRTAPDTGPGTYYETLAAHADHPVHPAGRGRAGLTEPELLRYAPEFHPVFRLRWAAVPRERVTAVGRRPAWWPAPADVGLAPAPGHDLLPLHPLTVPPPRVRVAPEPYLEVRPTLSMRTVAVDPAAHLKVPLPTSTLGRRNRRTIAPDTLADGARAERLLRGVLAREPDLPVLLADEQTYGHAGDPRLGYLVRRFPAETAGVPVVPVAALLAPAPDGGWVIERWGARELFGTYLTALFRWNVALFRYGIALEAHQQNVSLVLGDRLALLLKDNDGALVDPRRAGALGPCDFADTRMRTTDPEALARVFVTITLHLCAAAPAFGLAERGLLPLRTGLGLVRERLDAALGPEDAHLRARTLDADRLPTKAMVTAGTLVDKARTGARDINKHYGPPGPNYLRDDSCY
ncbi:IucA/IucC family protein [Actinomadura craniellae]|uniref:IucA/IucC family protein n=1 Tax=Actinomadura craniellae TaxID=2231787 RepID=UPI001F2E22B5|nr:IucA/IucC family protein [Actinomadura craniellae]